MIFNFQELWEEFETMRRECECIRTSNEEKSKYLKELTNAICKLKEKGHFGGRQPTEEEKVCHCSTNMLPAAATAIIIIVIVTTTVVSMIAMSVIDSAVLMNLPYTYRCYYKILILW